jgi:anti-sigma regulatory factor (Ser/Thr protein kinase)
MAEVELRVPARAEHLALVRLVVSSLAEQHTKLSGERLDDLRLAVSEACANAVEAYSRRGVADGTVVVTCDADREHTTVEIRDEAGGFEVDAVEPMPPATDPERLRHEHGLGIALMRALADAAEIRSDERGTSVRLTFSRPGGLDPPSRGPAA